MAAPRRRRDFSGPLLEPFVSWVELDPSRFEPPPEFPFTLPPVAALATRGRERALTVASAGAAPRNAPSLQARLAVHHCTHSPILLAYPGALIYRVSKDGLERTAYEDTDHYRVTLRFLQEPQASIEQLFLDLDTPKVE